MNPLKSFETALTSLVEGAFGRLFRSEVRPMELARKLAREMDEHRTVSVSRVYAPNEYALWLSSQDRARYEGVEEELIDELCAYLLEHARAEGLALASHPVVTFHTDPDLSLGEFGIQARLVRPEGHEGHAGPALAPEWEDAELEDLARPASARPLPPASALPPAASALPPAASAPPPAGVAGGQAPPVAAYPEAEHGRTMVFSGSSPPRDLPHRAPSGRLPRAMLLLGDRRLPLAPEGATVGRSRECDIVLDDAGVSRRHARIRPAGEGWTIEDLHSTNGVLLNGEPLRSVHPLHAGDRIELGSTEIAFEVR
jgi:hypothetical protein